MSQVFDRIQITVPDLAAAKASYSDVLGPPDSADDVGRSACWVLANTAIEVTEVAGAEAAVSGLVIASPAAGANAQALDNALGLNLGTCDGSAMAALRESAPERALRIDHLVLRTDNGDACVELFRDQLGIRLALDQTVEKWGGRMLFFRGGKMTLEVIQSSADGDTGNYFWGIAYQCDDIDAVAASLAERGVALSDVRDGRKPGTRVATLKSHCLDIPSLLIQQG